MGKQQDHVRLPHNYARDFYDFAPENLNTVAHGWRDLTSAERRPWIERARKHYAAGYRASENRQAAIHGDSHD